MKSTVPDDLFVHSAVTVDHAIAHANDLTQREGRVAITHFGGQPSHGLADPLDGSFGSEAIFPVAPPVNVSPVAP